MGTVLPLPQIQRIRRRWTGFSRRPAVDRNVAVGPEIRAPRVVPSLGQHDVRTFGQRQLLIERREECKLSFAWAFGNAALDQKLS